MGLTLNYTYDSAGHVASIASSNTNGASMSYAYDSLNRLRRVAHLNFFEAVCPQIRVPHPFALFAKGW